MRSFQPISSPPARKQQNSDLLRLPNETLERICWFTCAGDEYSHFAKYHEDDFMDDLRPFQYRPIRAQVLSKVCYRVWQVSRRFLFRHLHIKQQPHALAYWLRLSPDDAWKYCKTLTLPIHCYREVEGSPGCMKFVEDYFRTCLSQVRHLKLDILIRPTPEHSIAKLLLSLVSFLPKLCHLAICQEVIFATENNHPVSALPLNVMKTLVETPERLEVLYISDHAVRNLSEVIELSSSIPSSLRILSLHSWGGLFANYVRGDSRMSPILPQLQELHLHGAWLEDFLRAEPVEVPLLVPTVHTLVISFVCALFAVDQDFEDWTYRLTQSESPGMNLKHIKVCLCKGHWLAREEKVNDWDGFRYIGKYRSFEYPWARLERLKSRCDEIGRFELSYSEPAITREEFQRFVNYKADYVDHIRQHRTRRG
ncbi:hypothetical protein BT63DRAFT_247907 [Microthyrium microscopicum]|uniref:Uncharacterized protein n=1 Tax=Microthyrium microscopicum TaxID=703497 RepID=A0A6A6U9Z1_9PEZI|nr:hypothetical protein BT63DRAFT_247907 [Microthyrium microscopicum]